MKHRITVATLLCAMVLTVFPVIVRTQTTNIPNSQTAAKFDYFGEVQWSDLIARLDNFAVELQNNPSSRGYLIFYRSHRDIPGISSRYANLAKLYMINARGLDTARIKSIDGGMRDCLGGELWIVPAGAVPPTPTDTYDYSLLDTTSAYKFDETYYPLPTDLAESGSLNVGVNLEGFAAVLKQQPLVRGYIIMYGQHYVEQLEEETVRGRSRTYTRTRTDLPSVMRKILAEEKRNLVRLYGINPARIVTVNGGYRKGRNVELWIVPRGERPPVPTPNVYPPRRKKKR